MAITYDSQEILRNFSEANKIAYPLLSDPGSEVIRAYGIFNTNIPEDYKRMYGVPWPGDYLIAPDGTVRDKLFLPDYQHRPSASAIVLRNFASKTDGNSVAIATDQLRATIALSTDRCFAGQELGVSLEISLKPGWHIYGRPLPASYQPTELIFEGPLVGEQSLELPPAKPMMLKALGETLSVFEGEVRAIGKLGIKWSPPVRVKFLEAIGKWIEPGDYKIAGQFRFQPCSETACEPPQAIDFELPLRIEAGTPAPPKKTN